MIDIVRKEYFPISLTEDVVAKSVEKETITDVWKVYADVVERSFKALGNYVMPKERRQRNRALQDTCAATHEENFVFYEGDNPVGWSSGVMTDPSTFFIAYSAVLPHCQRQGIYGGFLRAFLPYLYALGYERATSNHMVNNRAVLIAKLKAGFYVTGMVLDERYGAQVSLGYLFHQDRREGFANAYSLQRHTDVSVYIDKR